MQKPEPPIDARVSDLEARVGSLEGLGKEGLPAIRLVSVELRLGQLEQGTRDLKDEVGRRFGEIDRRFDRLEVRIESTTQRLTLYLGLFTGIITLVVAVSGLLSR